MARLSQKTVQNLVHSSVVIDFEKFIADKGDFKIVLLKKIASKHRSKGHSEEFTFSNNYSGQIINIDKKINLIHPSLIERYDYIEIEVFHRSEMRWEKLTNYLYSMEYFMNISSDKHQNIVIDSNLNNSPKTLNVSLFICIKWTAPAVAIESSQTGSSQMSSDKNIAKRPNYFFGSLKNPFISTTSKLKNDSNSSITGLDNNDLRKYLSYRIPKNIELSTKDDRSIYFVDTETQCATENDIPPTTVNQKLNISLKGKWLVSNNNNSSIYLNISRDMTGDTILPRNLPPFWTMAEKSNNRFIHITSSTKTNLDPRAYSNIDGRLQKSWIMKYNSFGYRYFINLETGNLTTTDPRPSVDLFAFNQKKNSRQTTKDPIVSKKSLKEKYKILSDFINKNFVKERVFIHVDRENIFKTGCASILKLPPFKIRNIVCIKFLHESGIDYGALLNDFIQKFSVILYEKIFIPISKSSNVLTLSPSPSIQHDLYIVYGRLLALALFHKKYVAFGVSRMFFKALLKRRISIWDVLDVDPEFGRSLIEIKNNDIDEMDLGLTFSQGEVSNDGKELELIPGGANILVTEENKLSYIELIIEWKYIGSIQKKLDIITNAFEEVMPVIFLDIFTTAEIELVLCGQKKIDIDDWEKNTNYFSGYTSNSTQIKWFWAFLRQSNEEIQSRMLQFVTGTSSVPLEGFANLKSQKDTLQFSIKKVPFKSKYNAALPVSHACFNSLELPEYPTYEMLVKKLTLALTETDTFELK